MPPRDTPAQPLALRGGVVFDSATRSFRPADIFAVDGCVQFQTAAPAHELDCSGKYIIPGLIDCHVHMTGSGDSSELSASRTSPLAERADGRDGVGGRAAPHRGRNRQALPRLGGRHGRPRSGPLDDIAVLTDQRAIRAVIQGGRIVRSDLSRNEE